MKNWQHDPIHFAPIAKLGGGWIAFKDSPSPPPAPDYRGAAQAQGAANVETARAQGRMNNPNVTTPYGQQTVTWGGSGPATYNWNGQTFGSTDDLRKSLSDYATQNNYTGADVDKWLQSPDTYGIKQTSGTPSDQPTITQTLAPAQQQLLDAQNRISGNLAGVAETGLNRVGSAMAQPFDQSNIHPLQADAAARQAAQDAAYRQQTSRLDPQWNTRQQQQETQLRNQGLVPGSEAYDNAMRDFNFGRNDAYSSAFNNSFNTGLAAQQADFGMQNQANTQNTQLQAYLRSLPLNELNALRTGSQVQNPQFQGYNPSQVAAPPIFGAAQAQAGAQQNAYNAQVGQQNAMTGGLFQLGAAAVPFFM